MPQNSRPWLPFCGAVLVATLLGSIVQTQFNLAALQQLGATIPGSIRVHATVHDLFSFSPTFAALIIAAFIVALPVATWLSSALAPLRWLIFALAGALAVWLALSVANAVAPMPTLIGANRTLAGTLALMVCGSLGSLAYARLRSGGRR
ncbi:hypothetical protein D16iCDA_12990 [Pseudomonas seleniipraecipitans]|uniref:Major facilitator superfamily (MFS) profile domain-containing protein n=1 Tax=Phytopseudomonas seleniipraecipitans TaxID=640205 RepID=A0ABY5J3I0_9GAMM|nr:hypothetical protein [Pseudomonas seleniipraecipitans]UUD62617.1 hypothetical protein D16iCDA_12990 [Pseudomonas seleniipraecipitans]